MASWRDAASQQAQDDLDGLLNAALPFAQQMLDKHGEFFPFAVAVDVHSDTRMIMGDPDLGERPPSAEVLSTILEELQRNREKFRAIARVSDVRAADSDAVRVEVEHSEGPSMAVLLPYRKRRLRSGVEYGSLEATVAAPAVWV
jgi:hypothetical protein